MKLIIVKYLAALIAISLVCCNHAALEKSDSFWESQKGEFKYINKQEFVNDSLLEADIKSCKKITHSSFEKMFDGPVYLYSWQQRDSSKNEFTVVAESGENRLGLTVWYMIFDKKDKLLALTVVASRGYEGTFRFESRSHFIHPDTLLEISSTTEWYDLAKQKKAKTPKGDSTFTYLTFKDNGSIEQTIFKEVKMLKW